MKGKNAIIVQLDAKAWFLFEEIRWSDDNNKKALRRYADNIELPNKKNRICINLNRVFAQDTVFV